MSKPRTLSGAGLDRWVRGGADHVLSRRNHCRCSSWSLFPQSASQQGSTVQTQSDRSESVLLSSRA